MDLYYVGVFTVKYMYYKDYVTCIHRSTIITMRERITDLTGSCPEGTEIMVSYKNPACSLANKQSIDDKID